MTEYAYIAANGFVPLSN